MINTVVLDCGHGGIDPKGNYTTAPKKMYRFNNGVTAYEGVINMQMGKLAEKYLNQLGLNVVWTRPKDSYVDMPLNERVQIANATPNSIMWSIHNNAGGGKGFEIFTSKGQTKSDIIAQCVGYNMKVGVNDVRFRADTLDGDLDKEADYYVLRKTKGCAILTESHFFDVWSEYKLLTDIKHLERIVWIMSVGVFNGIQILNSQK